MLSSKHPGSRPASSCLGWCDMADFSIITLRQNLRQDLRLHCFNGFISFAVSSTATTAQVLVWPAWLPAESVRLAVNFSLLSNMRELRRAQRCM